MVYIDALDEQRSGEDKGEAGIIKMIEKLQAVKPAKVRIADRQGERDLGLFKYL